MQLYKKRPMGIKPAFSRDMVELSLMLHVPPQTLYNMMFELRKTDVPHIQRLWKRYGNNNNRLKKDIQTLKRMWGFNNAEAFYDQVEVVESFEHDFKPIDALDGVKPIMLIMTLDLYFRLVPNTMVTETDEIRSLAKKMGVAPRNVVAFMNAFKQCDPYISNLLNTEEKEKMSAAEKAAFYPYDPLLLISECKKIWQRYGNDNPEHLAALASQMQAYFK